ncbi:MFS transporter [Methylobacterium nonmethylotrophicum]|uniref:MFS transporter n=1 Tax=Methylobacterium nonmethylotrophicum TaxID=1141884 RepID=UPI001436C507|nr:MFS transporter [Methylobacterium nonmethylotrophicum]
MSDDLRRRAGLSAAGFGAMLNLYACQPILPDLQRAFGVSPARAALTVTATAAAVALVAPVAGAVSDAAGRKPTIVAALALIALPSLACALAPSLDVLICLRFLQGLFMPAAFAACLAYASEEWPPALRGRATTLYVTANITGGFLGRVIGGLAAEWGDWHAAFLVLGLANLLAALAVAMLLPRSRGAPAATGFGTAVAAMPRHLGNPALLSAFAVGFAVLFCLAGVFTYVNYHLAAAPFGLSAGELSWLFGTYLVGLLILPVSGRWIDRFGPRRAILLAIAGSALGGGLTLAPTLWVIVPALVLVCLGAFVCQAAATAFVGRGAAHHRSAAAGLYLGFYYAGGAAGAFLPGFAYARLGWPGVVAVVLAVEAAAALLVYSAWRDPAPEPRLA